MLFLGMPSWSEWLIILLIALLLFGGAKLPALARSMGASVNEFKKGLKDGTEEAKRGDSAPKDAP